MTNFPAIIVPPTPALVYFLNEGTGTTINDSSGNSYGGTLSGTTLATWVTGQAVGPSTGVTVLNFESAVSSKVASTATSITQMGSVMHASLTGWVYIASGSDTFSFGLNKTANLRFALINEGAGVTYMTVEGGVNANYPYFTTPAVGWHFFVVTFDGTQSVAANRVLAYVDNVRQTVTQDGGFQNPQSLSTAANMGGFLVSYDQPNTTYRKGEYCDLRLYATTLTQNFITYLYNTGPK